MIVPCWPGTLYVLICTSWLSVIWLSTIASSRPALVGSQPPDESSEVLQPVIHALDTRHTVTNWLCFLFSFHECPHRVHYSHLLSPPVETFISQDCIPRTHTSLFSHRFVLPFRLPVPFTTPDQTTNYACWQERPCNLKSTSPSLFGCLYSPWAISFITFYSTLLFYPSSSSSSLIPLYLSLIPTPFITLRARAGNSHMTAWTVSVKGRGPEEFLWSYEGGCLQWWVCIPNWLVGSKFYLYIWSCILRMAVCWIDQRRNEQVTKKL